MPRRRLPLLAAAMLLAIGFAPAATEAGPLRRRLEERQACQSFAGQLRQASGNPQQAQQVYQQGVLKLVETFGSNPCTDIPAPTAAAVTPAAPPAAPASAPASAPAASPANPRQAQACADFAAKLQAAQASGDTAQAQRIFQMGSEKTAAAFGPNACPNVKAP
ncbi:MAG: hypothetical protein R6W06_04640 [Prochlorococcaceae cyanobacterium]